MDRTIIERRIMQDLEAISKYTSTQGYGCTRLPFTKESREAAEYLKSAMKAAGLEVWEDNVGNVFGLLPGKDQSLPAILSGSHYDSVYNGGNYDGIAGVISSLEVARILQDQDIQLDRNYIVAALMDEEGTRFGTGFFGSKVILGQVTVEDTKNYVDRDGISVYDAMKAYGLNPEDISKAAWRSGSVEAFVELHIEQGPVLDANKIDLGLVTGIVGIQRYMFHVKGRADHAGTTPMDMRIDPVEVAAKVISQIGDFARACGKGTVATVGFVTSIPGGVNVVAESTSFSVDIRSIDNDLIDKVFARIIASLEEETEKANATFTYEQTLEITPVDLNAEMLEIMEQSANNHGFSHLRLPSGAGHDALAIAPAVPKTAMLFVPSENGRSHSPEEYSPYRYFAKGAQVLFDLVQTI